MDKESSLPMFSVLHRKDIEAAINGRHRTCDKAGGLADEILDGAT